MEHYLVDTNLIVDILRGYTDSAIFIDSLSDLNISVISWYELIEGVENTKQQKTLEKYLSDYQIFHITESISKKALDLVLRFNLSNNLQHDDALIASTCLEYGLVLATRNIKHFKSIDGLQVVAPYNEILPNSPVRA